MTPVTLVTRDSAHDSLTDQDYADIYAELRQNHSLAEVVAVMQSELSRASWNQFEKGDKPLTNQMRNDLRRPFPHLAQLRTVVADAPVYQVGDDAPKAIVLVGGSPVTLHVNGSGVTVQECPASGATRPQAARKQYVRPCVPLAYVERLQRLGVSWLEVIEAGLLEFEA